MSDALQKKRPWVLSALARTCGMTEMDAAHGLPEEMRVFAPASAFEKIWKGITQWAHATFISQQGGFGMKFSGNIPEGRMINGIYHFSGTDPFGGHVRLDSLGAICFLTLPFMGKETCSVQFFDREGHAMFAVHVGKVDGGLCPVSRDGFFSMRREALDAGLADAASSVMPVSEAV
ncbi:MAG: heme utilization cystosolic carrier protein HutX [Desulfovibrio sp.]|nr:heme utilization cystosolic carrier protein HutX [Mailhella sp.]